MKKLFLLFVGLLFLSACAPSEQQTELPPLPTGNHFIYQNFYFSIPEAWQVVSSEAQQVLLEIASEPDQLRTTVLFSKDDHYFPSANSLTHTSVDGLNLYNSICYGGLACYAIEDNGVFTLMTWTVPSSTETMPEGAAVDWQPNPGLTADEVLNLVKSIRRAN
jgi:hypothetical protein